MSEVNLTLDGTGTESLNQITTLTAGTVTLSGGTAVLGGLTDANASSFLVSGGASLTLPALTSYAGPINLHGHASGHGEQQSAVAAQAGDPDTRHDPIRSLVQVQALAGGEVELPCCPGSAAGRCNWKAMGPTAF